MQHTHTSTRVRIDSNLEALVQVSFFFFVQIIIIDNNNNSIASRFKEEKRESILAEMISKLIEPIH